MSELNKREQALVAMAAALASNCVPCIEFHIPKARQAGCSEGEIKQTIEIADKVRQVPARMVLQTALARVEAEGCEPAREAGPGCGCAASNEHGPS